MACTLSNPCGDSLNCEFCEQAEEEAYERYFMDPSPTTPAERWQAAVDAETASIRDEFDRLYEGMSEAEIAARAEAAIAKFSKGDGQ